MMFGKDKTVPAKTAPMGGMASSGIGMMLKSMGVDPVALENAAGELVGGVQGVEKRLAAVEAKTDEILALLRAMNTAPVSHAAGGKTGEAEA